jgi:stringent starvation protein B
MELFDKKSYKELVIKNCYNSLDFLLKEGVDFSIAVYTNIVTFNPPIPKEIIEFDESALFVIANYTKESCTLTKDKLSFEAGFGVENFGSTVTVPLEAIMQLIYNEDILHISYYEPKVEVQKNSMELLLNNPENKKLLKKRLVKK